MKTLFFLTSFLVSGFLLASEKTNFVTELPHAASLSSSLQNTKELLAPDNETIGVSSVANSGVFTDTWEQQLTPLMNFNFTGNGKSLSNLTPVIDYNVQHEGKLKCTSWYYSYGIIPYIAGQIEVRDVNSYLAGLMLPGSAGFRFDWSIFCKKENFKVAFYPLNFGFKLISNFGDAGVNMFQHNLRTAIALEVKDQFILGIQHTYGWHNAVSEGELAFQKYFKREITDIRYLLVSLQMKINPAGSSSETYLSAEWRGMFNQDNWKDFPNSRIFTVGLRKGISIISSTAAKDDKKKYNYSFQ